MAVLLERYKSLVRALSRPLFLMDGDQDDLLQEGMIALYNCLLIQSVAKVSKDAFF